VWGASISFVGPFSGRLVILASETILPDLVKNMLGLDAGEEVSLAQQHDALMELLSIVCGNVLPAVAGKKVMFNLDVPQILSPEEYDVLIKKQDPVSQVTLELETGQIDFILFLEEVNVSLNSLPLA
jgi:chemotaxis protein CheY-P-specific phosphatase CheC